MKNILKWMMLLLIAINNSCVQNKNKIEQEKVDTSITLDELLRTADTVREKKVDSLIATIPSYTNAIYKNYIPSLVAKIIEEQLPNWKLPPPNVWDKFWFNEYKTSKSLVNYITADFNGDGKNDYSLILVNGKKAAIWVLQSQDQVNFKPIKLFEMDGTILPLEVGIEVIPKGELNYLNFDDDTPPKPIQLDFPAIQVVFFEQAAETYYWKSDKYESVTTGD